MVYQGLYKCKLCGKMFVAGETYNDKKVNVPDHTLVNTFAWHYCHDGSIGAGEALGLTKREDLMED